MDSRPKLIATLPYYSGERHDVSKHPLVDELRFNTITPLDKDIPQAIDKLIRVAGDKPLWIDLKARQIRVDEYGYIPDNYIKINQKIAVDVPARVLFKDTESVIEAVVDGDKLIVQRLQRHTGKGEALNIPEPSLKIQGFLTFQDRAYIKVCNFYGIHNFMLSFVWCKEDIEEIYSLDSEAKVIAKIEDWRGIEFVQNEYLLMPELIKPRLMAATDDLYINMLGNKALIIKALRIIIQADPTAIAASRILTSIYSEQTDCMKLPEIGDFAYLWMLESMGYKNFMLSDEICRLRDVFKSVMEHYEQYLSVTRGLV